MNNLLEVSQGISALLGLLGVLLFGYMLIMGMAHKTGRTSWYEKEKERRKSKGKPNINLISGSVKPELPWNDPSLIQGGFTAIKTIGLLFLYVVLMLAFFVLVEKDLSVESLAATLPALLTYPVTMSVFFFIMMVIINIYHHKLSVKPFILPILITLGCGFCSFYVLWNVDSPPLAFVIQVALLVAVSLFLSHLFGMVDGINDADIESRFPLVDVISTSGMTKTQLRLYEKTDTDYRFIDNDGFDHIFPSSQISEIKLH
jgi:hypothetical protein